MAGPTPIYRVSYDGNNLPGYVQSEDQPISFRTIKNEILNRDGGSIYITGGQLRSASITLRVLSRLASGTGLQHLNDCKAQYRQALAYLSRFEAKKALMIGDTDRYLMAVPNEVSASLTAGEFNRITYSVSFTTEPWYYSTSTITDTFTGNDTVTLTMTDTRRTYPSFSIPSGVTAFTATHAASGKSIVFTRGVASGTVVVDAGAFTVDAGGVNAYATMGNLDFGMYHSGAGTMSIVITGFAGAGTVTVSMKHRYEL